MGAQVFFMIFFWRILGSIYWALKWFWWFFKNELQHVYCAINIMRVYKSHNHNVSNKNHALQRLASLWDYASNTQFLLIASSTLWASGTLWRERKDVFVICLIPNEGVWYRRYTCVSCHRCLELDFKLRWWRGWGLEFQALWNSIRNPLQAIWSSVWSSINDSTALKIKRRKAQRKKKSLEVKRLIVSYLLDWILSFCA